MLPRLLKGLDRLQRRHTPAGFCFAVLKKYGDDSGGYHAALLTYYGFLSLFPLLLILMTILQLWFSGDTGLQARVTQTINEYLPLVGAQLQESVHGLSRAGWALVVGLLVAAYGTRGVADALRFMLNNIWQVPKNRRAGFPRSLLQSLLIVLGIAVGFAGVVGASSLTAVLGHGFGVKLLVNIGGALVVAATLLFVFRQATMRRLPFADMLPGVAFAAIVMQLLVTCGGLLVAHQLKGLGASYGTFALVLGLFFWLYLVAQVVVLAAEIDTVRHLRLWPRALRIEKPTDADNKAYALYAAVQRYVPDKRQDKSFK